MEERDLQHVLDAMLDGLLVVDAEGNVERINDAACRILDTSAESVAGLPVERLLGPGHSLAKLTRAALATGRAAVEGERQVKRRLAGNLVVDVAVSPLGESERIGAVVSLRDRTLKRNLEKERDEREHLNAFGRFAAGIAHEVKNPLAGIRGVAELLAARAEDASTRESADLIVREAGRIAGLVEELMVFTQGDSIALCPVNVHRVLDDVLQLVAAEDGASGLQIQRLYDPSIPELLLDGDRLKQVFLNLARNALQAMEGSGRLSVETRTTLDHRVVLPGGESVPTLLVDVGDDGPGIAPELLEKVATPLFSTRLDGTGLGLAVARHWVARHDGTLRIKSQPGRGTRVRVALPMRFAAEGVEFAREHSA